MYPGTNCNAGQAIQKYVVVNVSDFLLKSQDSHFYSMDVYLTYKCRGKSFHWQRFQIDRSFIGGLEFTADIIPKTEGQRSQFIHLKTWLNGFAKTYDKRFQLKKKIDSHKNILGTLKLGDQQTEGGQWGHTSRVWPDADGAESRALSSRCNLHNKNTHKKSQYQVE